MVYENIFHHTYISSISFLILAPQLISTLFEVWPQIIKMTHHHPGSFHIMRIYIYAIYIHLSPNLLSI